jgi:hypothetical protein
MTIGSVLQLGGGIRERPWARADVATLDSLLHSGIWRVVADRCGRNMWRLVSGEYDWALSPAWDVALTSASPIGEASAAISRTP